MLSGILGFSNGRQPTFYIRKHGHNLYRVFTQPQPIADVPTGPRRDGDDRYASSQEYSKGVNDSSGRGVYRAFSRAGRRLPDRHEPPVSISHAAALVIAADIEDVPAHATVSAGDSDRAF